MFGWWIGSHHVGFITRLKAGVFAFQSV